MIDDIVLAGAAAAEVDDRDPDRADVDRGDRPARVRLDRPDHGRVGQVPRRSVDQIDGAAQLEHHRAEPLGRRAALERSERGGAGRGHVAGQATQHEHLGAQRERHLEQPLVVRGSGQVIDRLPHLDRVARRPPQHLVHVGEQCHRRQPVADRHLDDRLCQLAGAIELREHRARADLDVHDQRIEARREFLREDRAHDQGDRFDGSGRIADRVEPAVGGGKARGLPDDRAPGLAHDLPQAIARRPHVIARDRLELVERAPGVPEAAPRDHRDERAARGEDRREQQAHLVADPARRVLVQDRAGQCGLAPVEHVARARHRPGQRDPLGRAHSAPYDRHRQRPDLRVGDGAVRDSRHEL